MFKTIKIELNAANPNIPFETCRPNAGSAASFTILNVPRPLGKRAIEHLYVQVSNVAGTSQSFEAVRVGSAWGVTVPAAAIGESGTVTNGVSVWSSGTDDNGDPVPCWILGVGDLCVLNRDGSVDPGVIRQAMHVYSSRPSNPFPGDVVKTNGTWEIFFGGEWQSLAGSGDVKHSDFSDMSEKEGMTLKEVGTMVNTLVRKLKGTVAAVFALVMCLTSLVLPSYAEDVPLSPDMDFGDIHPTNKLKAVVEASGAISGIDTNGVREIVEPMIGAATNALGEAKRDKTDLKVYTNSFTRWSWSGDKFFVDALERNSAQLIFTMEGLWDGEPTPFVDEQTGFVFETTARSGYIEEPEDALVVSNFDWQYEDADGNLHIAYMTATRFAVPVKTGDTLATSNGVAAAIAAKQDVLTSEQLANIADVPKKADEFTEWEFSDHRTEKKVLYCNPVIGGQFAWNDTVPTWHGEDAPPDGTYYAYSDTTDVESLTLIQVQTVREIIATRKRVLRTGDAATPQELAAKRNLADNTCHKTEFGSFSKPSFEGLVLENGPDWSAQDRWWFWNGTFNGDEIQYTSERHTSSEDAATVVFDIIFGDDIPGILQTFTATRSAVCFSNELYTTFSFVTNAVAAAKYVPSETDPTFSNAVLAVQIDTNLVSTIGELNEWIGDYGGMGATTLGGLLAALLAAIAALKKNKVGSFASVGDASATVTDGVAELSDFFRKSDGSETELKNSLLQSAIDGRLPYPLNTNGTIKDRAINVVTSGAFVIPQGFHDLLIRYTGIPASITFSGTDASIADYGDDLPTETGDYLITVTRTKAAECYIRIVTLTERA